MSELDSHLLKYNHSETGFPWYVAVEVDGIRDLWKARVEELEQELASLRLFAGDVHLESTQNLEASQQQVKALREALGWPERLGMFCMYCGKTSSAMHCQDCFQRMREMPILAAHEFNANAALSAPIAPVEEGKKT